MKNINRNSIITLAAILFFAAAVSPITALAATTPSLGAASTFGILGSTYTNTAGGTSIIGDLGYTTGPAVAPTVSGTTYIADGTYNQAGTDQGTALTNLNSQPCTFTFAAGAIDLAADTTHGPLGVYAPGVYCTQGAGDASIGTAGITLSGSGTYIFRINGALTTVANSGVTSSNGASANDVFWTPAAATTLGANTAFVGTDIDASGITIGSTVAWRGRALAFGGTVSTNADTITVPTTLHVIKLVVGGTAVASNFNVHVKQAGADVLGSPAAGAAAPGTTYALSAGNFTVSEDANSSYTTSFTGVGCDSSGNVTLATGGDKICTIVNTAVAVVPPLVVSNPSSGPGRYVPLIGILKVPTPLALPAGSGSVTYNYTVWNLGGMVPLKNVVVKDDSCSPVTLISGDTNNNGILDVSEHWKYSCTAVLSKTTTNTAVVTAYGDDGYNQATVATALATVVVGAPLTPPLINLVKVPSRLTPFPFGGGNVTYTYTVTNPGIVAMKNVVVTDNKCSPVTFVSGDSNNNNLLDPGETWIYTCKTNVPVTTMNSAAAQGTANGFTALSYAFATVLVSAPGLPNTGFPPQRGSAPWGIVGLFGILLLTSTSSVIALRKRKI